MEDESDSFFFAGTRPAIPGRRARPSRPSNGKNFEKVQSKKRDRSSLEKKIVERQNTTDRPRKNLNQNENTEKTTEIKTSNQSQSNEEKSESQLPSSLKNSMDSMDMDQEQEKKSEPTFSSSSSSPSSPSSFFFSSTSTSTSASTFLSQDIPTPVTATATSSNEVSVLSTATNINPKETKETAPALSKRAQKRLKKRDVHKETKGLRRKAEKQRRKVKKQMEKEKQEMEMESEDRSDKNQKESKRNDKDKDKGDDREYSPITGTLLTSEERAVLREENRIKKEAAKQAWLSSCDTNCEIVIDCSYQSKLREKEITSLKQQIMLCYAANKRAEKPSKISVTSFNGQLAEGISAISGYESWPGISFLPNNYLDIFPKEKVVYLTSDSPNEIQELDSSCKYIIGGIVDHGRLKNLTYQDALKNRITTAKFPLHKYVELGSSTVLTVNHVVDIILALQAFQGDWIKSLTSCLPQRKKWKLLAPHKTEGCASSLNEVKKDKNSKDKNKNTNEKEEEKEAEKEAEKEQQQEQEQQENETGKEGGQKIGEERGEEIGKEKGKEEEERVRKRQKLESKEDKDIDISDHSTTTTDNQKLDNKTQI